MAWRQTRLEKRRPKTTDSNHKTYDRRKCEMRECTQGCGLVGWGIIYCVCWLYTSGEIDKRRRLNTGGLVDIRKEANDDGAEATIATRLDVAISSEFFLRRGRVGLFVGLLRDRHVCAPDLVGGVLVETRGSGGPGGHG